MANVSLTWVPEDYFINSEFYIHTSKAWDSLCFLCAGRNTMRRIDIINLSFHRKTIGFTHLNREHVIFI